MHRTSQNILAWSGPVIRRLREVQDEARSHGDTEQGRKKSEEETSHDPRTGTLAVRRHFGDIEREQGASQAHDTADYLDDDLAVSAYDHEANGDYRQYHETDRDGTET